MCNIIEYSTLRVGSTCMDSWTHDMFQVGAIINLLGALFLWINLTNQMQDNC